MINHVSEIKAINLPVVTGAGGASDARARLRSYARVQRVRFPCKSEGVVFPISRTANRPFKTHTGSCSTCGLDNAGKPLHGVTILGSFNRHFDYSEGVVVRVLDDFFVRSLATDDT